MRHHNTLRFTAMLFTAMLVATSYSCGQRSSNVETPSAHSDSGATDAGPASGTFMGDFQCTLLVAKRSVAITSCGIDESGMLSIIGPNLKMQGNTKQTPFGLALEGSITLADNTLADKPEAATVELFRQGAGNLAAVFVMADGQFAKLNLVPSTATR